MDEVVKRFDEASVYKENLKSVLVVKRSIAKTAIGRDVRDALSAYPVPVLNSSVTQRAVFAEAVAYGMAVHKIDKERRAAEEIEAVKNERMEFT